MRLFRLLPAMAAGIALLLLPLAAQAQISLAITIGTPPPPIPVYAVPAPPAPNYIWEPGYWGWAPGGYYWVPGTWVLAPDPNLYWTPGYWTWNGNGYTWINGYWAPQVGFYGGINYGGGYFGNGYVGARWVNNVVVYNTYVYRNINRTVVHERIYNQIYYADNSVRVSYHGGRGGIQARPTAEQLGVARGHHWAPTAAQVEHAHVYAQSHGNYAHVNHGAPARPAVAHSYAAMHHASAPSYHPGASVHQQHYGNPHGNGGPQEQGGHHGNGGGGREH